MPSDTFTSARAGGITVTALAGLPGLAAAQPTEDQRFKLIFRADPTQVPGKVIASGELGVCWSTVMEAVIEHGTPLVDDPDRVGSVSNLGVDETSFLKANRSHATRYATGLVDLDRRMVIDMVEGNAAADLRRWRSEQEPAWLAGIATVATDLAESYRAGLWPHLSHAERVADPFHVVRVANSCVDKVRRRVQNETLGHRGRKPDPLYRIRKLLLTGTERLDDRGNHRVLLGLRIGDPYDEVLGAWLAKESVRDVYLTDDPAVAALLVDKAIAGCAADDVEEIRSLGKTLSSWRNEIVAHHRTGASNGPTEGLNLSVKQLKRCGRGFRSFDNYRLRVLLHAGGIRWPERATVPRLRTRSPHSDAQGHQSGTALSATTKATSANALIALGPIGFDRSRHRGVPRRGPALDGQHFLSSPMMFKLPLPPRTFPLRP